MISSPSVTPNVVTMRSPGKGSRCQLMPSNSSTPTLSATYINPPRLCTMLRNGGAATDRRR